MVENNKHVERRATCHCEVSCKMEDGGSNIKKLHMIYGNGALKVMPVYKWVAHYKEGQELPEDDPYSRRFVSTHNNEKVKVV